LQLIFYLP